MDQQVLFWTQVAAIGQVAGAAATLLAVIVSLRLATYDRSPRLTVSAGLRLAIPGDGTPATDIIAIKVENVGGRSARIVNVAWKTGWTRRGPSWLKVQLAVQRMSVVSAQPPVDLQPGQDLLFYITLDDFSWQSAVQKNVMFFSRQLPWANSPSPANIKVLLSVVGVKDTTYAVESGLARFLATGVVDGGAAKFNERADAQQVARG